MHRRPDMSATRSRAGRIGRTVGFSRWFRTALVLSATALAGMCFAVSATASEGVRLSAKFTPYVLGAGTTLTVGFHISSLQGGLPSPLTHVGVVLPAGLGFAGSTLGLGTCEASVLAKQGPAGCPPDAVMGQGTSTFEVPFGPEILRETTYVTTIEAPSTGPHTNLLYYAEGRTPVAASVVFSGELRSGEIGGQTGTVVEATVPLVPAAPGAPDVSVTRFETTFGPEHLKYYRYVHGRRVAYRPQGIALLAKCPRGGFRFAASFGFEDGTQNTAKAVVPCPPATKHAGQARDLRPRVSAVAKGLR
jgi:hypothetical protein